MLISYKFVFKHSLKLNFNLLVIVEVLKLKEFDSFITVLIIFYHYASWIIHMTF